MVLLSVQQVVSVSMHTDAAKAVSPITHGPMRVNVIICSLPVEVLAQLYSEKCLIVFILISTHFFPLYLNKNLSTVSTAFTAYVTFSKEEFRFLLVLPELIEPNII